jgi:hypothetical protein
MLLNGLIRTFIIAAFATTGGVLIAMAQASDRDSLVISLRNQVGFCWRGVGDLGLDGQLDVVVYARLNRDGSLSAPAEVRSPEPATALTEDAAIAVERAVTAVNRCAPYALPEDKFDWWDEVEIVFAPPVPEMIS